MKDIIKTSWQTARTFLPSSLVVLFVLSGLAGGVGAFGQELAGVSYPTQNVPDLKEQITPKDESPYAGAKEYDLQDIIRILGQIRDFILVVGIIFIVIMVIWAGISYVMAGGSEEGTAAAKGKLIGALIGAAIILAAFALIQTVSSLIENQGLLGGEGGS